MDKQLLEQNMQKMQTGDEQAFETVYNQTKKQVFFVIFSIIKDYGIAEELMQDAYIKIRKTIGQYRANTNAQAWIMSLSRNIAINTYNRRKREIITDEVENEYLFSSSNEDSMINNMLLKKLLTILDFEERQVVTLYTLGYKHREIATQLDKPLGTVLWIYSKAIKKLQKEVKGNE
ncbi:MAG: RNA polymerase sigma factor [Clostridia bacterium]|nr:RNA polymerase sigma factor [Clostridia bacterium]